jgi:hypothetical protein
MRTIHRSCITALVLAAIAAGCSKSPTAPSSSSTSPTSTPQTTFSFTSDPASLVGRGESPSYTPASAAFQWSSPDASTVSVIVQAHGEADWSWRFLVRARGQALAPGTYRVGSDISFELSGRGGSCGLSSGTVAIEDIERGAGFLARFRARFSVSCNNTPPINGLVVIHFVAGEGLR